MSYSDDFAIIGAATDDFDCEAITGWTAGGTAVTPIVLETGDNRGGSNSIQMRGTAGVATYTHDIGVGDGFDITAGSLNFWFRYSKGKGAAYLGAFNTLTVRLFFGGTVNFADYNPSGGDAGLLFGWNLLQLSGTNTNFGTPNFGNVNAGSFVVGRTYIITTLGNTDWNVVAGTTGLTYFVGSQVVAAAAGSGTGVASDTTNSIWSDEVRRVQLRLNLQNANDKDTEDAALLMDSWFYGTKIIVSEGTPAAPINFEDIETYSNDETALHGGSAFPLGQILKSEVLGVSICALEIGSGSDGTNQEGNVRLNDINYLLMSQTSTQVKAGITVKNFSSLEIGEVDAGVDGNYGVRGCQLVQPANAQADIVVENGGTLKIFNSKIFRFRDLFLGAAVDTLSTIELRDVKIDSCRIAYFRANTLDLQDIEIYNNNGGAQCGEMIVSPDSCINFLVHDCAQGLHFRDTLTITEYFAQDNIGDDFAVLDGEVVTIVSGVFDDTKIGRLTS